DSVAPLQRCWWRAGCRHEYGHECRLKYLYSVEHDYSDDIHQSDPHADFTRAPTAFPVDHLQSWKCTTGHQQGNATEHGLVDSNDAGNALGQRHFANENFWTTEICPGALREGEPEPDEPGSAPADDWALVFHVHW